MQFTTEHKRLVEHRQRLANWKQWGPYLSERSWGTVREDYSRTGDAWNYFPHDQARSRAYRWSEDGIGGVCDRNQYLCFAPTFWNGQDEILKERFFGLTNQEGNHGEDVKEYYFYLDNTPAHTYMKIAYKYPQNPFPYRQLVEENQKRGLEDKEFELLDTGIFNTHEYFDIIIEYAKADQSDILIRITAHNRASHAADLYILPTLWFRNTWSWGYPFGPMRDVPIMPQMSLSNLVFKDYLVVHAQHPGMGSYMLYAESSEDLIFTNNETNNQLLFNTTNVSPYVKDAFHRYFIKNEQSAINPHKIGTKAAAVYSANIGAGTSWTIRLRLANHDLQNPFIDFNQIFSLRHKEADEFYEALQNPKTSLEENKIQREALAGLFWSKQLYYYDVEQWRNGDPNPLTQREKAPERNKNWEHLINFDIISMPDKWEYPWYASWDLCFHCVSLVLADPDFAKRQLTLMTREWYLHPNGQLPAYEWNFGDSNPPVIAWAAWRVYKIDAHLNGTLDREFLSSIFHKLLINFTWWVNRKDAEGRNVFQGGFLGLDNISIVDRSTPLLKGGFIYQSDATGWMAFYCILMIKIAMELARDRPIYEDMATKFFEHFLRISRAMINCGGKGYSLWNPVDNFFYDVIALPDSPLIPLKVRSLVGLLPLLAVESITKEFMDEHPLFKSRVQWFINRNPHFELNAAPLDMQGTSPKQLLAILNEERLRSVLRYMLDENEFLSEFGIRSLSKYHDKNPFQLNLDGKIHTVSYEPAEAESRLFGGNSNWRGPIWFPLNFLIIESLQKFHYFYGDSFKVECPTGSGNFLTLWEVATELSRRLIKIFLVNNQGRRPFCGDNDTFSEDPNWKNYTLFHEYFHAESGLGLGASHQTGWTALIAKLIQQSGRPSERTWRQVSKNYKTKW